jgi:hypothetical protein
MAAIFGQAPDILRAGSPDASCEFGHWNVRWAGFLRTKKR